MTRGAFIVFEGCDRSGKSTQARMLKEKLNKIGITSKLIGFPDRTTNTGLLIDKYLRKEIEFCYQAIHLLFSANRWEIEQQIRSFLSEGITVIVDRYSFSGVAYSAAKPNSMGLEWYKAPESGLPKPDLVFYLHLEQEVINKRGGFGIERYETEEMQRSVQRYFDDLKEDYWQIVDADCSIDNLHEVLLESAKKIILEANSKPLLTLW